MKNDYEVRGEETVIYIPGKDGIMCEVLIDTVDFKLVNSMPNTWRVTGDGYAGATMRKNKQPRKHIRMHRLIMEATPGSIVDHINHNTFDNRKCNLRFVTDTENQLNRKGAQSNSKSGIRGVVWHKREKKWRAQYNKNGKCYHVGTYERLADAEKAMKKVYERLIPCAHE